MQNIIPGLLLLTVVICGSTANAASVATITALQSPVWIQQGASKIEIGQNRVLKIGDSIATGDSGRAQIQLWVDAILLLNSNSEIGIRAGDGTDIANPDHSPELYLHYGRACIFYTARSSSEGNFKVNLGNSMFAAIHLHGNICVLRQQGLSAIKLHAGSVELTHAVDSDTIILSEAGTEFHIDDNGSYEILFPGGGDSATLEIETPFIVAQAIEKGAAGDSLDTVESNGAAADESIPETTSQETLPAYIYTVYLFSTRSEASAEQANQKFQKAGHDTQIFASTTDSGARYRVAATGFESRQAAQAFSDSIVGKLGVKETWIGKDKSSAVEAVVEAGISGEPLENVDSSNSTVEVITATEPETTGQPTTSAYVYTVYLFSTQSEENAERVNQKFQQAGHDTHIFASTTDSGARYRVAATGFESRQSAQAFADSIEGRLGVTDTWIGKETR
jgi:cell division septation protein DedD